MRHTKGQCWKSVSRCGVSSIFSTTEAGALECTQSAGNVSSSTFHYKGNQTTFHTELYSFGSEAVFTPFFLLLVFSFDLIFQVFDRPCFCRRAEVKVGIHNIV